MRKLECSTLLSALKGMKVGETCIAPDGYNPRSVIYTCSSLRKEGYVFTTSQRGGEQTITRQK